MGMRMGKGAVAICRARTAPHETKKVLMEFSPAERRQQCDTSPRTMRQLIFTANKGCRHDQQTLTVRWRGRRRHVVPFEDVNVTSCDTGWLFWNCPRGRIVSAMRS